ncbi:MAG: hypothetical protein HN353_13030 [Bdellovibrionales bacterium]|jgi:hypothetical protein|nr:hypothetical protein [Bdellovibrionales bacterium]MBT3525932.1 hypothetical protein [Bdellovibrionales bacterium]MBT7670593.1 hypothetical protein [Bdellovibrionales bacterium]MBT7765975.1 hypothetical protein [Bdellovibrionales bacterium]
MSKVIKTKEEERDITGNSTGAKRRGRRPKNNKEEYQLNREQTKFFIDLSNNQSELEMVFKLLTRANKKDLGREVSFKDLALFGIEGITNKDIEKLQERSLSKMEKVEQALKEYNRKNGLNLDLGDFLIKKLAIN